MDTLVERQQGVLCSLNPREKVMKYSLEEGDWNLKLPGEHPKHQTRKPFVFSFSLRSNDYSRILYKVERLQEKK